MANSAFLELAKQRYSCRKYTTEPVSSADLKQILEAACLAPSAVNTQSCQFYVVNTQEKMQKMAALRNWFGATALIVVCTPSQASWTRRQDQQNFALTDLGILIDHMALCTTSLNLGSCIICSFDPKEVQAALGIPTDSYPMAVLAVGHMVEGEQPSEKHFSRLSVEQRLLPGSDPL